MTRLNHSEKAERWYFFLWAALALFVLVDAGVLATTPTETVKISSEIWLQQIIDSAKVRSSLYMGVGLMAFLFFYKQDEIMTWLEIHAPF